MQLSLEEQEVIRRAFYLEGKAILQIEGETGHSRQAIRNALSLQPPSLTPSPFRSAPVFGPFQARIQQSKVEVA